MPATKPEIVLLDPVPAIAPGLIVQFPAGKPFNTTLPVATSQLGWVIKPTIGFVGVTGCAFIAALVEDEEVHPDELVTVYEYVPAIKLDTVVIEPVPAIDPGFIVQFPVGNPFINRLPVAMEQVGWVFTLTTGAVGVTGCGFITISPEIPEVHPDAFVTVYA